MTKAPKKPLPPVKRYSRSAAQTRGRIIDRSIALFNKRGIQNVSVEHVAADLDISPGNLTYHFKRKRDLILATLDVLQQRLDLALERSTTVTCAEDSADYMVSIFRTIWNARFFFNALPSLLADDELLRKEYFRFIDRSLQTLEADLNKLHARGFLITPAPPNTYRLLAENMWGQWMDWLRKQQIKNPTARTPALYECALHHWSLSQPFMDKNYAEQLLAAYQKKLLKAG